MIDLGIWAACAVLFIGIFGLVVQLSMPPTLAQVRAGLSSEAQRLCLAHPSTAQLVPEMRDNVCSCMADRLKTAFGGLDQRDFDACRQRVALRMANNPALDRAFATRFPQLCSQMEASLTGHRGDGNSSFCGCLAQQVSAEPVTKAAYAFGNGEAPGEARTARVSACKDRLVFGDRWEHDGPAAAFLQLPLFLPVQRLALRCEGPALVFEALSGSRPIASGVMFTDEGNDEGSVSSDTSTIAGATAYTLAEKLLRRQETVFLTDTAEMKVTLRGFEAAAAPVLAACPEPARRAAAPVTATDAPDLWQTADAGHLYIPATSTATWWATLVCDWGPPYMTLQGPLVEEVIARYPDPAGDYLAAGVPLDISGPAGPVLSEETFCDYGANEGDTDSCFVVPDSDKLDRLFGSASLSVSLGGTALPPFSFGASPVVQGARDICYRALEAD